MRALSSWNSPARPRGKRRTITIITRPIISDQYLGLGSHVLTYYKDHPGAYERSEKSAYSAQNGHEDDFT